MRHLFGIYTLFILVFFSTTLNGQDTQVPHTRTLPSIENPAFPYATPEVVGLSMEKLNRLAYLTEEVQEGRDAFLEKRDPDWEKFPWIG